MKYTRLFALPVLMLLLISNTLWAQKGTIRGSVIDDANGEALFGVTVVIEGTTTGAATDFDGKFEINVTPGTYNLQVSFISYKTITIQDVVVNAGEVTLFENIRMKEDVEEMEEVVVTAKAIKTTEEALLTVKRKSANVLDGISAANFKKIGDSDAAAAVKRVPGVSIEGGKYVYVRGLGDRYTKSILNGVDIPGLDPDRNTLQMDIFPTNVIDNIIVLKSFTSDLPADFVGGLVNIDTKDFPEEKSLKVSLSAGFNPDMHFNNDYLTYNGGSTDFLGFDDGTRAIPTGGSTDFPQFVNAIGNSNARDEYVRILNNFNPTMGAMRDRSNMDFGFGVSLGNQKPVGNSTLGYNFSMTYKNDTKFYDEVEYGRYGQNQLDPSVTELDRREFQVGSYGVNNVLLGGLAGIALKTDQSKYKINFLHLQNGESKAGKFDYFGSDQGSNFEAQQTNLEYSERALSNILINGTHVNKDGRWEIDWKLSPTRSKIEDPDIRFTRIRTDGTNPSIGTESGLPERIWRFLEEYNAVGKTDVTRKYEALGEDAKLKFGTSYTYKQRDYNIQSFQIIPRNVEITLDPDVLFLDENLFPMGDGIDGTRFEPTFIPNNPNDFEASVNNIGVYVSNEMNVSEKIKTVIGLRAEQYTQYYTGQNQTGSIVLTDEKVLDDLNFFPTANIIYGLTENQNLRFSYSRTIARPSFKEASYAEILDPITGRTFIGGFFQDVNNGEVFWDGNLRSTTINNYDLRWEIFQKRAQTIAVSGFYKTFDAPIEIVQFASATGSFQPRNVGDGEVIGAEVELRQDLSFISPSLEEFSFNGNFTFPKSSITMSETEFNSRVENAREGQTIEDTRDMAGQAPYIINFGFSYNNLASGLQAGLYYNVQGRTLKYVSIVDRPDIYTVPFHSLNFTANKSFGLDEQLSLGVKVNNILNDRREEAYDAFGAEERIFTSINPGTTFSVSFGYKIF